MTRMTLAKALRIRKSIKGEIADLARRSTSSVSWVEGAERDFDFNTVNRDRQSKVESLVRLETAIARANTNTTVSWNGRDASLAELIRRQQELKGEIAFVSGLTLERGPKKVRNLVADFEVLRRGEQPVYETITMASAYSEAERAELLKGLRTQCEELNETLEEANHRTMVEVDLS